MITQLNIENFRAFDKLDLPLSKINLFFGPNNSGKSSLISPITLLSQTLQSPDSDVNLLLSGKFEDLGTYSDMVYKNDIAKHIKIGLKASFTDTFRFIDTHDNFKVEERELPQYYFEMNFAYRKQRHEIILKGTEIDDEDGKLLFKTRYSSRLNKQVLELLNPSIRAAKRAFEQRYSTTNCMPNFSRFWFSRENKQMDYLKKFITKLREYLINIEYIGPFRADPERTYLLSGENPSNVGKRGDKAIDILVSDEKRRGKQKKGILNSVSDWLFDAGVAKQIIVQYLTDRHFEMLIKNIETEEQENLVDTGFGCSQVLPIIVAGLNRNKGDLLIMQQPEIHLHPKAQAGLGSFINTVAQKGVQIILETHSEHLLLRVQSHIASGELKPDDVFVYYFDSEINPEDNKQRKVVHRISFNENGLFRDKWPKGFFPERLNEARRLAKLSIR